MTLSDAMDQPEFLVRFSDISPVPYQVARHLFATITSANRLGYAVRPSPGFIRASMFAKPNVS